MPTLADLRSERSLYQVGITPRGYADPESQPRNGDLEIQHQITTGERFCATWSGINEFSLEELGEGTMLHTFAFGDSPDSLWKGGIAVQHDTETGTEIHGGAMLHHPFRSSGITSDWFVGINDASCLAHTRVAVPFNSWITRVEGWGTLDIPFGNEGVEMGDATLSMRGYIYCDPFDLEGIDFYVKGQVDVISPFHQGESRQAEGDILYLGVALSF